MPEVYRFPQIREVLQVTLSESLPSSEWSKNLKGLTSVKCWDDFARKPRALLHIWLYNIASRLGYRQSLMREYHTSFIEPFYRANTTRCLEVLESEMRNYFPVLLNPSLKLKPKPFRSLMVEKKKYLETCVIFRLWLDLEPFSLLGVTLKSIESVETRCQDVTAEKIAKEVHELD